METLSRAAFAEHADQLLVLPVWPNGAPGFEDWVQQVGGRATVRGAEKALARADEARR